MKKVFLGLIALGLITYLMFSHVYEPDQKLKLWCNDFINKDDGSIDEPLMKIIRDACK